MFADESLQKSFARDKLNICVIVPTQVRHLPCGTFIGFIWIRFFSRCNSSKKNLAFFFLKCGEYNSTVHKNTNIYHLHYTT